MAEKSVGEFMVVDNNFMNAVDDASDKMAAEAMERAEEKEESREDVSDAEGLEELEEDGHSSEEEEDSDDDEDEEETEASEESDDEEQDEEDEGEDDSEKAPRKAKKYLATLSDGTRVDLTDDTTIKIKVNGKFEKVPLETLKEKYNGEVKHEELIRRQSENTKKLESELSRARSETEQVRNYTKSFMEGVTKGDFIEAMGVIAEMSGESDVNKVVTEAVNGIAKAIEEMGSMSQDELTKRAEAYKKNSELSKRERALSEKERAELVKAQRAEVNRLAEANKIEVSDMQSAYQALVARNEELKQGGQNPVNFTVQDVADVAVEYKIQDEFLSLSEKHKVDLSSDDLRYLRSRAKLEWSKTGGSLKENDYVRLLSEYGNKELGELSRKVSTNGAKTSPKRNGSSKRTSKKKVKSIVRDADLWGF